MERWRRIAREAAEQSRRISPPEITAPMKLKDVLPQRHTSVPDAVVVPSKELSTHRGISGWFDQAVRIVLAETEREAGLTEILRSRPNVVSLALAVGPEGGWTDDELQSFAKSEWIAASLGDTILRAETAAIAALAIARAEV